jgi:hypothetical protein
MEGGVADVDDEVVVEVVVEVVEKERKEERGEQVEMKNKEGEERPSQEGVRLILKPVLPKSLLLLVTKDAILTVVEGFVFFVFVVVVDNFGLPKENQQKFCYLTNNN